MIKGIADSRIYELSALKVESAKDDIKVIIDHGTQGAGLQESVNPGVEVTKNF